MIFVTIGKARSGSRERVTRRLEFEFPPTIHVLGEYWTFVADPALVLVTESDDLGAMMDATSTWDDLFEFTITPAIPAEQGIAMAKAAMAKAGIAQHLLTTR